MVKCSDCEKEVCFFHTAKKKIMEIYPPAKELYVKYGMYNPEPGEGLAPRDIKPRRDVRNGVELLIVEGNVVNIVKETIAVPKLQVSLTNPEDKPVATQVIDLNKESLEPGESIPFKAEFENPPGTARKLDVKFLPFEGGGDASADGADHAPADDGH